jgi:hypothetical protein
VNEADLVSIRRVCPKSERTVRPIEPRHIASTLELLSPLSEGPPPELRVRHPGPLRGRGARGLGPNGVHVSRSERGLSLLPGSGPFGI